MQVWMVHHLQIIGEAAARLPPDLRSASPRVPWSQINPDEVWAVVDRDIPALREEVVTLLSALTGTEGSG